MEGEKVEALDKVGDPKRGEEAYEVCGACHLPNGSGRPDGTFPQLAGQHSTVLIKQIADIRAGRRDNPSCTRSPSRSSIRRSSRTSRPTCRPCPSRRATGRGRARTSRPARSSTSATACSATAHGEGT
jgi:hypothetical protein